jgi:hypothetical protein
MSLEKIQNFIDNLELESQEKLFIKELKRTTVQELIICLQVNYIFGKQ